MELNRRIDRLERDGAPDQTGLPPCPLCASGENRRTVIRSEGQPEEPLPTCPACGRCVAIVFNFRSAEPTPRAKEGTA